MLTEKKLNIATVFPKENNIITIRFKDEVVVDVEKMITLIDAVLDLAQNQPFLLLSDARDILSSMDHEAREYMTNHEQINSLIMAHAIVVNNMPTRIISNFFINFYKRNHPISNFSSIDGAKEWLSKKDQL